jgi:acyl transferase domain-containing protein/acyl-CoA synthetase (AMP-forming)/AMP-acid ligase II/acyl carrier protein
MFKDQLSGPDTLIEMLTERATSERRERGFVFLEDGESAESRMNYIELDRKARAIGAYLSERMKPGDRALILYPPGLEYIAAFYGCVYAGVVAVPAYPPDPTRLNRTLPRLQSIIDDAGATVVLTTSQLKAMAAFIFEHAPGLSVPSWYATDEIDVDAYASSWQAPKVGPEDLAFLQYTSGSTGHPKGVMLSHANLLANERIIFNAAGAGEDIVVVNWLPLYHDMGLIGGVLQPVFAGGSAVLMSPIDFLKRPVRWLQAMSRHRGTSAAAPNFAFDLVVRKTTQEQRDALDLSSWCEVCNGAEPIRRETMERFSAYFAPAGFRPETFFPSYGLAECTLLVSLIGVGEAPRHVRLNRSALEQGRVVVEEDGAEGGVDLSSCGPTVGDFEVAIVDPTTRERVAVDRIGEVWIRGASVASGYWGNEALSQERFGATIVGEDAAKTYFRSGDLGFTRDGDLFITGRLKDLIIIRGANHYPQDIEGSVEACDEALRPGCGAAFSVELDGQEELVVVYEFDVRSGGDPNEVALRAARAIVDHHDISAAEVVLIESRTIEKTSSGKIQRQATRQAYLDGELEVICRWTRSEGAVSGESVACDVPGEEPTLERDGTPERKVVEEWLIGRLSAELGVEAHRIALNVPFANYGMSSLEAVSMVGELEQWLGREIPATLLYDYPTVSALALFLSGEGASDRAEDAVVSKGDIGRHLSEPLAVVGMACRFPGAEGGPQAFWDLLVEGREGIREVPASRWDIDAYYDPEMGSTTSMNTRRAGFIEGIDVFDAAFFGISKREAEAMDPQQRLLLEVVWEALEDAGVAASSLEGSRTGVFVGLSGHDFGALLEGPPVRAATGIAPSIAANRISYLLDLRGPSMVVDTACSSSLVAIDQAVQSLRLGRCNMAIVGGVNAILSPQMSVAFSQAGMLSPDGRCKTFDAKADGYVRGEGCGVVVLKRLSDALNDGDRILAQIRGTAVNQDGRSNGLTAPNGLAQQAVIREALEDAGVRPEQVTMIEAHGTGTELGDAIEVAALNAVFGANRKEREPVYLGSVKTNIGHLEAGAGIAGLIKTVLCLSRATVVPHLNVEVLNPKCQFDQTPFLIPGEAKSWKPSGERRFASLSSFGFGGTNAHVVLEEGPQDSKSRPSGELEESLLCVSSRTESGLEKLARDYVERLPKMNASLADVAAAAGRGRDHYPHRLALVARSVEQARETLAEYVEKGAAAGVFRGEARESEGLPVAFLFTGQGAQRPSMGRELFETNVVFRQALERAARICDDVLDVPLLEVLFGTDAPQALIHQTAYAQPAMFALEYALLTLWQSLGITPKAVMGHSVGEYVAAYAAGVFSLEDGCRLICERGRLMQALPRDGAMAALFVSEEEIVPYLEGRAELSIAAVNGPKSLVVSGDEAALTGLLDRLEGEGILGQALRVSHAFHSSKMDSMLDGFEAFASTLHFKAPAVPMVSNLTGRFFEKGEVPDGSYWRRHVREAVRFADGMTALYEAGHRHFLEVGPVETLASMGKRCVPRKETVFVTSLQERAEEWKSILESAARLYVDGASLDFVALGRGRRRALEGVGLPTYPFERRRYWPKTMSGATTGE